MSSKPDNQPENGSPYRIRDPRGLELSEVWLVSSVVAILGIRGYLHLTGYPQVGGSELHIAHLLWGGLGLVISFGILLLFASDVWKPFAAFVGGLGFGTFIDELGKFITKDNDYFFRPTIGLFYGILVALYLLAGWTVKRRTPTSADHLYYATQGIQSLALGKLDFDRQQLALGHLDASKSDSSLAQALRSLLENAPLIDDNDEQSSRILGWRKLLIQIYVRIVDRHWFTPIVIGIFVIKVGEIIATLVFGLVTNSLNLGDGLSFPEWGTLVSSAVSSAIAAFGLWFLLRRERLRALNTFAISTLFSILFGQFFAFTTNQFAALGNLLIQLFILGVLRFSISAEKHEHDRLE